MSRKSIDIEDTRIEIYHRDLFICQYPRCKIMGWENLQMAHRISRSKKNIEHVIRFMWNNYDELLTRKEAEAILNNKLNLVTSCADHNQLFLIDSSPIKIDKLLRRIKQDANYEDTIDECIFSGRMPT